uniref:Uncharacterized protein n=1 Tax=Anguilla anguilla TaxID=7936 RepID=A0A0E9VT10_ANGAN
MCAFAHAPSPDSWYSEDLLVLSSLISLISAATRVFIQHCLQCVIIQHSL